MYIIMSLRDTQVPSLENWGGGLKSLLWLANSPKCPQTHRQTQHKFPPGSHMSVVQITGSVCDGTGRTQYFLRGYWDESIHIAKVLEGEGKEAVLATPELAWTNVPPE